MTRCTPLVGEVRGMDVPFPTAPDLRCVGNSGRCDRASGRGFGVGEGACAFVPEPDSLFERIGELVQRAEHAAVQAARLQFGQPPLDLLFHPRRVRGGEVENEGAGGPAAAVNRRRLVGREVVALMSASVVSVMNCPGHLRRRPPGWGGTIAVAFRCCRRATREWVKLRRP